MFSALQKKFKIATRPTTTENKDDSRVRVRGDASPKLGRIPVARSDSTILRRRWQDVITQMAVTDIKLENKSNPNDVKNIVDGCDPGTPSVPQRKLVRDHNTRVAVKHRYINRLIVHLDDLNLPGRGGQHVRSEVPSGSAHTTEPSDPRDTSTGHYELDSDDDDGSLYTDLYQCSDGSNELNQTEDILVRSDSPNGEDFVFVMGNLYSTKGKSLSCDAMDHMYTLARPDTSCSTEMSVNSTRRRLPKSHCGSYPSETDSSRRKFEQCSINNDTNIYSTIETLRRCASLKPRERKLSPQEPLMKLGTSSVYYQNTDPPHRPLATNQRRVGSSCFYFEFDSPRDEIPNSTHVEGPPRIPERVVPSKPRGKDNTDFSSHTYAVLQPYNQPDSRDTSDGYTTPRHAVHHRNPPVSPDLNPYMRYLHTTISRPA